MHVTPPSPCRRSRVRRPPSIAIISVGVVGVTGLLGVACTGRIGGASTTQPTGLAGPINPGRVVAHRLNNIEYDNTIRDLTGQDSKPSVTNDFPADTYIEGFDNNADALTAPPLLLEKLQAATEAIVSAALDPAPANAAARARIMVCDPASAGEAACATRILTTFASRAFRRPVTDAEVQGYAGLVAVAKSAGDGFDQGIAAGLQAILLSPRFLFRIEANPAPGTTAPLDDYEVASRLSYFLWSTLPDDVLLQHAAAGTLHDAAGVASEVRRRVADPRASALVDNLAGEWLGSRELAVEEITLTDVTFDADLRAAMATEASTYLGQLLTGGRAIKELLASSTAFVNGRLAAHYGFANAATLGTDFTQVPLPDDRRSAGILTQANTLTVTSLRDRTSPTRRGKWVSENLLCQTIPPPPPQIPQLPAQSTTAPTSVRDRLALHRQKGTVCNGCHQFMDPIGLGLEHYDAVGRWRDTDSGAAIDASGNVPVSNAPFDGAISLAHAVGDDPRFLDCVVQKLLTYALGRSLVTAPDSGSDMNDTAGLADIRMRLGSSAASFAQLIELVATSPAMTMRLGEETSAP